MLMQMTLMLSPIIRILDVTGRSWNVLGTNFLHICWWLVYIDNITKPGIKVCDIVHIMKMVVGVRNGSFGGYIHSCWQF